MTLRWISLFFFDNNYLTLRFSIYDLCHRYFIMNDIFCLECGTSIAHGNTLIVNGFEAQVGIFPWHLAVYRKKDRTAYEQICAGTLISNNLVVSGKLSSR